MKFLDPNKKPFDISDEAGRMGALMGEQILGLENDLHAYARRASREDVVTVMCLHYLIAAARAAGTFFEQGEEDFPLDDFLASAGDSAVFIIESIKGKRRAAH